MAMVESAGLAAHLQAIAENQGAPKGASMWPKRAFWACDALNLTTTSANAENKSPFEMRYRKVPRSPFPSLRQGYAKRNRLHELYPKAVLFFNLGPAPNRPRDTIRVLTKSNQIEDTRNVTWARSFPTIPVALKRSASQELTGSGEKGDIPVLHRRVIEKRKVDNVSGKSDSSESDGVEPLNLTSGGSLSNIGVESDDGNSDSITPSSSESDDSQVDVDPRAPVATKTTTPIRRVVPATVAMPAGRATVVT